MTSISGKALCISAGQWKPHTAAITTAWLRSRRVLVLNWPSCSPDISPVENIWQIITWEIRQRRQRTLQQLETYIRQEWDQIPKPKLQKFLTWIPRCLQTETQRRVLLWIKYWLMLFEVILVFILFKFKNIPTFPEFRLLLAFKLISLSCNYLLFFMKILSLLCFMVHNCLK